MSFEGKHYDKIVGEPHPDQDVIDSFAIKLGSAKNEVFELEKTEREVELLDFSEKALDDYLEKFGKERKTKIPLENIHVVEKGSTEKITNSKVGNSNSLSFSITLDRFENEVSFAIVAFHEMVHLKSFQSKTNMLEKNQINLPRRNGTTVYGEKFESEDGFFREDYLHNLDEALTSLLERQFFNDYIKPNNQFSEEDKLSRIENSRQSEVDAVMVVIDKIVENSSDKSTKEDVIDVMMDAKFNGRLLPLARLVKNSIGMEEMKKLFESDKRIVVTRAKK